MYYKDIYFKYAKELSQEKYCPMTIEEERRIFIEYKERGTKSAFERIIQSHLRFVVHALREFKLPENIDIMDLIQAGNVGLIIGVQRFDNTTYGCRVATYCNYWIKFFIREALKDYASQRNNFEELDEIFGEAIVDKANESLTQKVSQEIVDLVFRPLLPQEKLIMIYSYGLDQTGRVRTLKDISTVLGITLERVRQLREGAKKKLKKEKIRDLIV